MMIRRINMSEQNIVRFKANQRLSTAVRAGGFLFISGLFAEETRHGNVQEQTKEILSRIDDILADNGLTKERVVTAQIWLTDISTFDEFNVAWGEWVPEDAKPARVCVETKLPDPLLKVEIMMTALL